MPSAEEIEETDDQGHRREDEVLWRKQRCVGHVRRELRSEEQAAKGVDRADGNQTCAEKGRPWSDLGARQPVEGEQSEEQCDDGRQQSRKVGAFRGFLCHLLTGAEVAVGGRAHEDDDDMEESDASAEQATGGESSSS